MDRRVFLGTLAGGLLATPRAARAQRAGTVYRIGVLSRTRSTTPGPTLFRRRSGQNVVFQPGRAILFGTCQRE
jgi:hypothetical protein